MKDFRGIITPIVTPFDHQGRVDNQRLKSYIGYLLDCGIHGVIPCGSTGEYPLLTFDERKRVAEVVKEEVGGRVPVVVGVTAVRNEDAVDLAKHAEKINADGLLVAPTYYYRPSERELYNYYEEIASVGLPIVVYNVPNTTKVDMQPEFLVRLSDRFENVRHVKECTGDISRVSSIIKLSGGRLKVLCGEDPLMYDFFCLDPAGSVSTASNVLPRELVQLYRSFQNNNIERAREVFFRVFALLKYIDGPKFVQMAKAALRIQHHDMGPTRKPLLPLEESEVNTLTKLMKEIEN